MTRDSIEEGLDEALDEAARCFERGDLEAARVAAEEAVRIAPASAEARHFLASALSELGEPDEAEVHYQRALELAPNDPEILLGACLLTLDRAEEPEDLETALALAMRGRELAEERGDAELVRELLLAEGQALLDVGEASEALERFERCAEMAPTDPDTHLQVGMALFDLVRAAAARAAFLRALALDPELATAHWYLGLIAERAGEEDEAGRRLRRANKLDPERFPEPTTLSEEEFDAVIEEALTRLPAEVRQGMDNLAITCEPFPSDEELLDEVPPLPPSILGLFRGHTLHDKQSPDPWAHFPSSVVLYQRNLERQCGSREELIEQIEVTLLHEIGHYLGWDEDDLRERGLH